MTWERVATDVTFTITSAFDNIGYAFIAIGIGVGAIIVALLWIKLAELLTKASSNKRYDFVRGTYETKTRKSSQSFIRLICMTLAILSVTIGFWVAFSAVGVNFWTIALAGGVLAMIGNYAFGSTLKNAGAFWLISWTDKAEEGWYVSGTGFRGIITAIHVLWFEVRDPGVVEENVPANITYVPTFMLLDCIWKRNFKMEMNEVKIK